MNMRMDGCGCEVVRLWRDKKAIQSRVGNTCRRDDEKRGIRLGVAIIRWKIKAKAGVINKE